MMTSIKHLKILIDESGTLPDPQGKVIILAAVCACSTDELSAIVKEIRRKRIGKERPLELKFYTAGDKTKTIFFRNLAQQDIDIFLLTIDKMGRKIADTPQNFAVLCWLLLESIFNFYLDKNKQSLPSYKIIFDRHFHKESDLEEFNTILTEHLTERPVSIEHVDSRQNYLVTVADMVAGAVLSSESGKDPSFHNVIKPRIISEVRLNWAEEKKRLMTRNGKPA